MSATCIEFACTYLAYFLSVILRHDSPDPREEADSLGLVGEHLSVRRRGAVEGSIRQWGGSTRHGIATLGRKVRIAGQILLR
jgi:hypothetical protein